MVLMTRRTGRNEMKMLRFHFLAWAVLALLVCSAGTLMPVFAQSNYGSIAGTVADSSGAAIADAQVTLSNVSTTEKRAQPSGPDGLYSFVNLQPGEYRIDVEKQGFKRSAHPAITVEVGQTARIDV